ncbi:MAG TPA: N-formylglutamate amidohydrolase [Lacipirellula sp.]
MDVFELIVGEGPIVAAAIHSGHYVRPEVASRLSISEADRLREEDPYTDALIEWAPTRLIGRRSRYEVDLNRPREGAVYLCPEQCWGVDIWREQPGDEIVARSLACYDLFYSTAQAVLQQLVNSYGRVVVLDIHSYNHRRDGADHPPADAETHPEVNIGTGTLDRNQWAPVVDSFIQTLRRYNYFGRSLDVRENVKFRGGHFCRWIHETFPNSVCALAVEFKKLFMDEWTGEVDPRQLAELTSALKSAAPVLLQVLHRR